MGLLNPILLLTGLAVAVPLILHLFHHRDTRRLAFPALRYLKRMEKEHARTIRFRQLLLLVLRMAAILLIATAAARPFVRGGGGVHESTALAIILDNSMSSGRVVGERRTLDALKEIARRSVRRAGREDRVWLLRAGEPWEVALTGPLEDVERWIDETVVSAGAGWLVDEIERAAALVAGAGLPAAEIHVISDLQRTAFAEGSVDVDLSGIPVVVFGETSPAFENRHLDSLLIGGGLPPLANQRSQLTVRVLGGGEGEDTPAVPLRLVVDNRIRGAANAVGGAEALLPLGPFPEGPAYGYVETDPDDLGYDDRQYFALRVLPPPGVWVDESRSFFLSQALPVLADAGRLRTASVTDADLVVAVGGAGLESRRAGAAAVVVPDRDPTLLPALNRRLASGGISWRFETGAARGETPLGDANLPVDLEGVRVFEHFSLVLGDEPAGESEVVVRLATGEPWLVKGSGPRGPYFLLASALDPQATNLPVGASLLPLLEWMMSGWGGTAASMPYGTAGEPMSLPAGATAVQDPEGTLHPVDGTRVLRETRLPGVYTVLREDSVIGHVALNPPVRESLLERIELRELRGIVRGPVIWVADGSRWEREVFVNGQGPELWWQLLGLALLVLVLESLVAATGSTATREASPAGHPPPNAPA